MSFDRDRNVMVLFGGSPSTNEIWEGAWSGTTWSWTQRCTSAPCSTNAPAARMQAAQWYDERLRRTIIQGGNDKSDTWAWDGTMWTKLDIVDAEGDGSPDMESSATAAYDPLRGRAFIFGGGESTLEEIWSFAGAGETIPGHAMHVRYSGAATDGSESPRQLDVRFYSGAASADPATGAPTTGVSLMVFDNHRWMTLAANSDAIAAPNLVTSSVTDPMTVRRYLSGGGIIHAAVRPLEESGAGHASVATDYAEVVVRYRWPGLCANDIEAAPIAVAAGTLIITGDTCLCSHDFDPGCATGAAAADAVWTFTTPAGPALTLDAQVSGFDSALHLREYAVESPALACNDDATPPGAGGSRLTMTLSPSTPYYLVVDGKNGACGPFTLSLTF